MPNKSIKQTTAAFEIEVEATKDNLVKVMAFVDSHLEDADCPMKHQFQIDVAVEEIFVNIASYAYAPGTGRAVVRMELSGEPAEARITFIDQGMPYDPLKKEDPDITLSAADRKIGGLGIYIVKQSMDKMEYEYRDGSNVLTLTKKLQ